MKLCSIIGHKVKGCICERCGEISSDRTVLAGILQSGSDSDAVRCAEKLIELKDYSCVETIIAKMYDEKLAVPLSKIPDEKVIMPLILIVSKYAILNLSVSVGNESFSPRSVSVIFHNLVTNFQDKVFAYLAEIGNYHFFFMKENTLLYTDGHKSFRENYFDRSDQIADCAREALKNIAPDRIQNAIDNKKGTYHKANYQTLSDADIILLLCKE